MHTDGYLKRQFNPKSYIKSEEEHISHFKLRLKERFDIDIDTEQYYRILANLKKTGTRIYGINSCNAVYSVIIYGKEVWIIFGKKNDRIGDRLKTALIPHRRFIVPDCLSKTMDHKIFTEQLNGVLDEFKKLSEELDLSNKKEFFNRGLNTKLAGGALHYKQSGDIKDLRLISVGIHYLIDTFAPKVKDDGLEPSRTSDI